MSRVKLKQRGPFPISYILRWKLRFILRCNTGDWDMTMTEEIMENLGIDTTENDCSRGSHGLPSYSLVTLE